MDERKEVPLQGRFDVKGGVLEVDSPWSVNKAGEPVQLFTESGSLHTEIIAELGLLGELGRRFDAGLDIGDQYSQVADRIRRKLILSESLAPKK